MDIYLDATTLIALGSVGELDVLTVLDGRLVVPETVLEEVTTEPARTNVERFCAREEAHVRSAATAMHVDKAQEILGEEAINVDVQIIADVFRYTGDGPSTRGTSDRAIGVVSDDRRVRTVAEGLGATVSGTVGVIVRATEAGLSEADGKELIRRIDSHGLHMTGELREKAYELIEEAAHRNQDGGH